MHCFGRSKQYKVTQLPRAPVTSRSPGVEESWKDARVDPDADASGNSSIYMDAKSSPSTTLALIPFETHHRDCWDPNLSLITEDEDDSEMFLTRSSERKVHFMVGEHGEAVITVDDVAQTPEGDIRGMGDMTSSNDKQSQTPHMVHELKTSKTSTTSLPPDKELLKNQMRLANLVDVFEDILDDTQLTTYQKGKRLRGIRKLCPDSFRQKFGEKSVGELLKESVDAAAAKASPVKKSMEPTRSLTLPASNMPVVSAEQHRHWVFARRPLRPARDTLEISTDSPDPSETTRRSRSLQRATDRIRNLLSSGGKQTLQT